MLSQRRRKFFGLFGNREGPPVLYLAAYLDSERHILTDDAIWDAEAWDMEPPLLPLLARTIRILGDALPQGFAFRATWVGSEVREEVVLSADALADLVRESRLNEFTVYKVPSRQESHDG